MLPTIGTGLAQKQTDHADTQAQWEIRNHATTSSQPGARRKPARRQSVRRYVIRLVLIPGIVAMTLWLVASGYLVYQGFYNRAVADSVRTVSIPAVPALTSIFQERRLSLAYLSQPSGNQEKLVDQRKQTDERLAALRTAATGARALAPDSIVSRWQKLSEQLDQLPNLRTTVDARSGSGQSVYEFYNVLLDTATDLFNTQARVVPDVTSSQGGITATDAFRASDKMTRAASKIDGAFASGKLGVEDYLEFAGLVGNYHAGLDSVAPYLRPSARAQYDALTSSSAWKELVAAENALITGNAWQGGVPRTLSGVRDRWEAITRQVSDQLIGITITQADEVSAAALQTGNIQLVVASLGSLLAQSITIAAIWWAIRRSRELPLRLAKLGEDASAMVAQRLPTMKERLRRHEPVDLAVELPLQDYGSDEIGQMAAVINRSLQAATGAAVEEAKTRVAGIAMLMGVARRPQRPVQRGLQVIEALQNQIGDEDVLHGLFDVNHQLTQTRRFLENLVILAGGQIGRRFRNPVPLQRVLLAAFAESQHYQRITLRRAADVAIVGPSVAETIHLLAELLDNAVTFSRPDTTVFVSCYEVSHGVAVEIEDAGVGMQPEALERANTLLATVPMPDVTTLRDGAQVGLHVVAELAKRDGTQVTLRPSAYGGLMAVVLLPERVIASSPTAEHPLVPEQVPAMPVLVPAGANGGMPLEMRIGPSSTPQTNGATAHGSDEAQRFDRAEDVLSDQHGDTWIPRQTAPHVSTTAGSTTSGTRAAGRPPLPHRKPQQHIVAELREDPSAATQNPGAARTPEEARDRLSRYQQALAAGKAAGHRETAMRDQGGNP